MDVLEIVLPNNGIQGSLGLAIARRKEELDEQRRKQEDYGNEYRDSSTPNSGSSWRKSMFGA
jgi:hypothetical protein